MRFSLMSAGLRALAATSVAAIAATGLPGSAAPSGRPVVIGAILSESGLYAPLGEPERNALQLAEKDINAHGGIDGRPVQIVISDDEGKADTAAQLATSFVGQNVALIVGGTLTATSAAISRVTSSSKIAQVYMTPTSQLWNAKAGIVKYLFEATPRNELEAAKLLGFAKTKLTAKRIAILHDDGAYGSQGTLIVQGEAKTQGLDVADDEAFPIGASDVTAQLTKIKSSGADTIVIWTASPTAAIAVRQIRQLGIKMNVIGSTGIVSDNFLRLTGKDGEGVYADVDLNFTHPNQQQETFLRAYRSAYGARPSNFASFAWDAAHIAALALDQSHFTFDGDTVSAALIALKPYAGTTGTYKFSDSDHNGLSLADVHIAIDRNAVWFTL